MKASVVSERGHPTPFPLAMGAWTPAIAWMAGKSVLLNSSNVVGTVRLLLVKKDFLYQKPGLPDTLKGTPHISS